MRLRFSIRDLLWLTFAVALGLGWFVHQQQLRAEGAAREQRLNTQLEGSALQLNRWTRAAKGMENVLKNDGWEVVWPDAEDPMQLLYVGRQAPVTTGHYFGLRSLGADLLVPLE